MVIITTYLLFACRDSTNKTTFLDNNAAQSTEDIIISDTVNKPELVTARPDGYLLLTAENGKAVGPNIKYMPEWRAFGWFTASDHVEWDVDIKSAGEYEVYLEWSVSNEEASKAFLLKANDTTWIGIVGQTGSWETYKTKNIGKVKLSEGRQVILFESKNKFDNGALLDLRQIKLTKAN
jgi:hypothetical protein